MLNKKFKKKWLKALRSEDFSQTSNYLRVTKRQSVKTDGERFELPVGHCCLGVGCEISPEVFPDLAVKRSLERGTFPTNEVLRQWGITTSEADCLANLNDNKNSFEYIADYIEENL